jgi:predicted Zn-dependent protease
MRAAVLLALLALARAAMANQFPPDLDAQRRAAQAALPADIAVPSPLTRPRGTVTLRIRFYADEDFRAGLFRWADRTKGKLEQLNRVVEPAFGIRLEAESFRRWHRSSGNTDVKQLLGDLEKLDPGPGVDLVVGFVAALSLPSASIHDLAAARALGRHFVMRGIAGVDESLAVNAALETLDPAAREQIQSRRKEHKEYVVFLHAWLHTLGAIHSTNAQRLNHPTYSPRMGTLSIVDTELAAAAIQARLKERQTGAIDWSGLRRVLDRSHSTEWSTKDRDELLASLPKAAPEPDKKMGEAVSEPEETFGGMSRDDARRFNRAVELTKANKGNEAWALAEALGQRYPKSADVLRMMCRLSYVKAARDEGLMACTRAHDLQPQAAEPLIDAAQARILRKEIPEALATTEAAAGLARTAGKPDLWIWIAQLYGQLGLLTRGEEALARAGEKAPGLEGARRALTQDRRMFGMPAGSVPADKERDYADRYRRVASLIEGNKLRDARAAADAARKEFPAVPGLEVLACEIEARQNRTRAAEKACSQALTVMPDLPRAHYLLGHVKLQSGAREAAAAAFRKSIELDPRESSPWQSLADVYRASGKRQELAALRAEYQKQFSRPLK